MTIHNLYFNRNAYFGSGAIQNIVGELETQDLHHPIIVTDKKLVEAGVVTPVMQLLDAKQIDYHIFDEVVPNPTVTNVKDGVAFAKEHQADSIIAVGGGSPMDTAKAIATVMTNPEFAEVTNLEGEIVTSHPLLPILAVPTTSGTASETTIYYVITDEENHRKFCAIDPHCLPEVVFIDTDLMEEMPEKLCAATGMDALTHAIEAFVSKSAWEMTDMYARRAIELIADNLLDSVHGDTEAREKMAIAQYMAGQSFSNAGLGLVHGMAHPLSAHYGMPHGVANAMLLPHVMVYNQDFTGDKYRFIAKAFHVKGADTMDLDEVRIAAIKAVHHLSMEVGIPEHLSEFGMKEEDIPDIARDALNDACTPANPRDAQLEEIMKIYNYSLHPHLY